MSSFPLFGQSGSKPSMCSIPEQPPVPIFPIHFYKVSIDLPCDRNAEGVIEFQDHIDSEAFLIGFKTLARAIQGFWRIFNDQNSTINWFSLSHSDHDNDFMYAIGKFMKRVKNALNGDDHKVKVRQFSFLSPWPTTRDFVNILNCLDSTTLEALWIQPEIPKIVIDLLIATEHWKTLKYLIFNGKVTTPISQLLPQNIYRITLDKYSGELRPSDVEGFIQRFALGNCSSLYGAFFKVTTTGQSNYDQEATLGHLESNLRITMKDTNLIFAIQCLEKWSCMQEEPSGRRYNVVFE